MDLLKGSLFLSFLRKVIFKLIVFLLERYVEPRLRFKLRVLFNVVMERVDGHLLAIKALWCDEEGDYWPRVRQLVYETVVSTVLLLVFSLVISLVFKIESYDEVNFPVTVTPSVTPLLVIVSPLSSPISTPTPAATNEVIDVFLPIYGGFE